MSGTYMIDPFEQIFVELLRLYEDRFNKPYEAIETIPSEAKLYIPVWGRVELKGYELYLIQIPIVNRLSQIRQLAHTYLYLLGASHTRLEHSVGVLYVADKLFNTVWKKLTKSCERANDAKLSEVCREFKILELNDKHYAILKTILRVAALLHDLGHSGWGHALDGIVGEVIDKLTVLLASEYKLHSMPVHKLDIVLTLYLLYCNEQLRRAICRINDLANLGLPSSLFLELIAYTIVEEEYYDIPNELDKYLPCRYIALILPQITGALSGLGGLNADRIDWLCRDTTHTEPWHVIQLLSKDEVVNKIEQIKKSLELTDSVKLEVSELNKVLYRPYPAIAIRWENNINSILNSLRESLYRDIYENMFRSFYDSVLTRLALACITLLYNVGRTKFSGSITARVLVSYLLLPDEELKYYTLRMLELVRKFPALLKHYATSDISLDPEDIETFLHNSAKLTKILDTGFLIAQKIWKPKTNILNCNIVIQYKGSQKTIEIELHKIDDIKLLLDYEQYLIYMFDVLNFIKALVESIDFIVYVESGKTLESLLINYPSSERLVLKLIDSIFEIVCAGARRRTYTYFQIPRIERMVINKDEKYKEIPTTLLLVNYYAFRAITDNLEIIRKKNSRKHTKLA